MPEIVEADGAQSILLQQLLELLTDKVRLQKHTHINFDSEWLKFIGMDGILQIAESKS